jgi:hypothetical protein
VAEEELASGALGGLDVHQDVLDRLAYGDTAQIEPGFEPRRIEVPRVAKRWAEGQVEADASLAAEEVTDLGPGEFLGDGALPPEEAVAALDRLGVALADRHHRDFSDTLQENLDRRVAVAGDVLDAGPQLVRVADPCDRAVVADAEQNLSAQGVGQGHELAGKGGGKALLVFEQSPFAFLEQDLECRWVHLQVPSGCVQGFRGGNLSQADESFAVRAREVGLAA